ncbi:MDR family MFS transporter [Gorillibacterium massiliense]|uniref:MDR family MFS transporter n=1 Tax=Gorillibacterium massiliense TaxID=1280390 RepID=UPI001EE1B76E|nr:MFS transporter [Gorillibacterium massiliense]
MSNWIPESFRKNLLSQPRAYIQAYHPIVHSLIFGTVLARAASTMSLPFLALYLTKYSSGGDVVNSLIIGISSLAGMVGGFIGGTISDRVGRKAVMLSALLCWSVVFLGFAVARSPWVFIILNVLNGLCRSFFEPVSQALMADLTPKEKRLKVFSLRYFAINVGSAVGPLAGAYFGLHNASLPFFITGIFYLLYTLVLNILLIRFGIRKIEGEKKSNTSFRSAWNVIRKDIPFRFFLGGAIIGAIGYSQINVTLVQYLEHDFTKAREWYATLISLNATVVVALQMPLTALASKLNPVKVITIGNGLFALGFVGFALSHSWIGFILSMFVFTLGEILVFPSTSLLIDRLAPEKMRGTYFGAQTFQNLGHFLGPILGGVLLVSFGGMPLFMIMAVLTLCGSLFYRYGSFEKTH